MAYSRPLGQTFNQLNLNMYRLPDGQRGALRSTSLALAREASREDSHSHRRFSGEGGSHLNPFKGIKRLYSGLRRHKSRSSDDETRLRKFYSTPLGAADAVPSRSSMSEPSVHQSKTAQTSAARRTSNSTSTSQSTDASDACIRSDTDIYPSPPRSPGRSSKRVRFSHSDPEVNSTYSPEEYDRRVVDPWEFLTKDKRTQMRQEMHEYTTKEMSLNDVYNTNDSQYCTLCWRTHCHCRALAKDIWRRDRSTSMVRAGA
ncbi:hypothetical protein J3B02_001420 [Coemansia erecta]|uniref:Uncharacterized protein n=1 Tax=Coemansia asiatica TaxID=1052880 RepID=A0A9W8CL04_9FUNG|nr:hypothetical protein LPJ64_002485 [Coemansia asiatica]KAJ2856754.1 hypothetical protein J3B02_001420 [Coemansia erecta]